MLFLNVSSIVRLADDVEARLYETVFSQVIRLLILLLISEKSQNLPGSSNRNRADILDEQKIPSKYSAT